MPMIDDVNEVFIREPLIVKKRVPIFDIIEDNGNEKLGIYIIPNFRLL